MLQSREPNEEVKCFLCSARFGFSTVGTGALDSHTRGKRDDNLVKSQTSTIDSFFMKKEKMSSTLFQSKAISSTRITLSFSTLNGEKNVSRPISCEEQNASSSECHTIIFV